MSEWRHLRIDELFKLEIGGTPSRGVSDYWASEIDSNAYSWASISDFGQAKTVFKTKEKITSLGLEKSNAKLLPPNTLIFSFKLTIGKVAFTGIPMTTNEAIAALIPVNNKIDSRLIYYLLPSALDSIVCDTAVKGKTLNKAKMANLTFRVPVSLAEQQKIADILSTVDDVIEKTEAAIEKYQAIKAGMMQDLFTRGIDVKTRKLRPSIQQVPELYKETELGWIPKEWEVFVFDDVIKEYFDFRGKTPLKLGLNWGGGSIKAISANNVEPGFINFSKEHYLASEDLYRVWMNRGDCSLGDVVMTSEAPLGVIAQIPDNQKYILSQRVFLFKANPSFVTDDYLYYLMNTDKFQNDLIRQSSGSTVIGIQQARLAKIKILLTTSIDEQRHISKILKSIDRTITDNDNMLGKYKNLKQGLMVDLLTGKVRVKINEDKLENS